MYHLIEGSNSIFEGATEKHAYLELMSIILLYKSSSVKTLKFETYREMYIQVPEESEMINGEIVACSREAKCVLKLMVQISCQADNNAVYTHTMYVGKEIE